MPADVRRREREGERERERGREGERESGLAQVGSKLEGIVGDVILAVQLFSKGDQVRCRERERERERESERARARERESCT